MNKKPILLIVLHNTKALGVGYLERALKNAGYQVSILFFKEFNSINPKSATEIELNLLKDLINKMNPGFIGLSVMSSQYLETVYAVNGKLKESFNIPVVWGGVFTSLFPEKCLEHADYVLRGEGEKAIVEFADALFNNQPLDRVQNLAYKKDGAICMNAMGPLCQNLDELGYPEIGGDDRYFINDNKLISGDPLLNSMSYELSASRGCPFNCSYCCSANLRKLYKGDHYLRFRSVSSVMEELKEAKARIKNLKFIHFWDEIFSDEENWISEFTTRYKKEINLPFEIWGHPLRTDKRLIQRLVDAGLYQVVMGIQSGSPRIRKEIFRRGERQEDILNADRIYNECRVPRVVYDFILRHPFETEDDIRQTYELCSQLKHPFELQLHGLIFFHGIDIVDMAVEKNIYTAEEIEKVMSGPMSVQYRTYWGEENKDIMFNFWYALTYMTQFRLGRPAARYFAGKSKSGRHIKLAISLYKFLKPASRLRHLYKKALLLFVK